MGWKTSSQIGMHLSFCHHTWYLSFFLHWQNFWRIKFTPKKRVNYDKIHSKLPIFCVITAKYTVNCKFFRVRSVKIYTSQKKFTWTSSVRPWQISGMVLSSIISLVFWLTLGIFLVEYIHNIFQVFLRIFSMVFLAHPRNIPCRVHPAVRL